MIIECVVKRFENNINATFREYKHKRVFHTLEHESV